MPHGVITPSPLYSAVLSQAVVACSPVIASLAQTEWLVCLKCCASFILFKTQSVRHQEAGIPAKESVQGVHILRVASACPYSFTQVVLIINKFKPLLP